MWEKFQKLLDRAESRLALWGILSGSGILTGGILSGWIASTTAWIDSYGPIGWWFAFLLGALLTALVLLTGGAFGYLWITASAIRAWKERVDAINPLQREFNTMRIKIEDLVHPITRQIKNKRFIDCELIGPAVILLMNGRYHSMAWGDCNFIVAQSSAKFRSSIVAFENVEMFGGAIWNSTVIIPMSMVEEFSKMGCEFITLTGDDAIDGRDPRNVGVSDARH